MSDWKFSVGDRIQLAENGVSSMFKGKFATVTRLSTSYGHLDVELGGGVIKPDVLFNRDTQRFMTLVDQPVLIEDSALEDILGIA